MSKRTEFIRNHFSQYLSECRSQSPLLDSDNYHTFPPSEQEISSLIEFLLSKNLDPIIVGSIAVIRYLDLPKQNDQKYRLTSSLEILISSPLSSPLDSWKVKDSPSPIISWISPSGGKVDFFQVNDVFPISLTPYSVEKDKESVIAQCPIASPKSLLLLKLSSNEPRDMLDATLLIDEIGFPRDLEAYFWTSLQKENFQLIKALTKEIGIPEGIRKKRLNQSQRENLSLLDLWLKHKHH